MSEFQDLTLTNSELILMRRLISKYYRDTRDLKRQEEDLISGLRTKLDGFIYTTRKQGVDDHRFVSLPDHVWGIVDALATYQSVSQTAVIESSVLIENYLKYQMGKGVQFFCLKPDSPIMERFSFSIPFDINKLN